MNSVCEMTVFSNTTTALNIAAGTLPWVVGLQSGGSVRLGFLHSYGSTETVEVFVGHIGATVPWDDAELLGCLDDRGSQVPVFWKPPSRYGLVDTPCKAEVSGFEHLQVEGHEVTPEGTRVGESPGDVTERSLRDYLGLL